MKKKSRRISIIFLSLVLCISHFTLSYAQSAKYLRVSILQGAKSLTISIKNNFEIIDPFTQKVLFSGKNLKTIVIVYKEGVLIGKMDFKVNKLLIKANEADEIAINGRRFRGRIQFNKKDNGQFNVVNYIDLEDYILGVLFHETSHYWPQEILKAQAIVCRSFALYQIQVNSKNDFDVTNDTYSQMYGGSTSERYRSNIAVEQTKGLIVTYKNKILQAYYHATCAGHTEDAALLWKIELPPLKGVVCGFCKESPHYRWHEVMPQDDFKWKLRKSGYKFKQITKIEILNRDVSGRITEIKLSDKDKDVVISAKDLRFILGSDVIRSTNFEVSLAGNDLVFEGLGWGHGVGMCQWGGYFMAKEGRTYQEILKYYYPGSEISSMDNL